MVNMKKHKIGQNGKEIKTKDISQMLADMPELGGEITLRRFANNYRRFKNNPAFFGNDESLLFPTLASFYNREQGTVKLLQELLPKKGTAASKQQEYSNTVINQARLLKLTPQ